MSTKLEEIIDQLKDLKIEKNDLVWRIKRLQLEWFGIADGETANVLSLVKFQQTFNKNFKEEKGE